MVCVICVIFTNYIYCIYSILLWNIINYYLLLILKHYDMTIMLNSVEIHKENMIGY